MSRVGRKPVVFGKDTKVEVSDGKVSVVGRDGKKLYVSIMPGIQVAVDTQTRSVVVVNNRDTREGRAAHGLMRALIGNMVIGVEQGYVEKLEVVGVGYQASLQAGKLKLRVGYANDVVLPVPDGVQVTCPDATHIVVKGCDKQLVGQFAASVRSARKPEPYKGKGVRYDGERVKIKPGKAAT